MRQSATAIGRAVCVLRHFKIELRPEERRRRILHAVPGLFPFLFHFCPQSDPLENWSLWVVTAVCVVGAVAALMTKRMFQRAQDHNWRVSVLGFVVFPPLLLWMFPDRSELACGVVTIIAFGDCFATLAGLQSDGWPLPWNPAKSWVGTLAFMLAALPPTWLTFWMQTRPGISPWLALECVGPAVVLSAIAESLPLRVNDNLRVGGVAAVTLVALHTLLLGA